MPTAAAATSLLRRHRKPTASIPLLLRARISSSPRSPAAARALPAVARALPAPNRRLRPLPLLRPAPPEPQLRQPLLRRELTQPLRIQPALLPAVVAASPFAAHHCMAAFSATLGAAELKETFAEWMAEQRWEDMKQLFEFWVWSLNAGTGKPNRPDVDLFNHYLRANLMAGGLPHEMLDLAEQMCEFEITPNTASHNLVLKSMVTAQESEGVEKLIER